MSSPLLLLAACLLYVGRSASTVQYGRYNYTEYHAGNMGLILTVAHGGSLKPDAIPDRTAGCWDPKASACVFLNSCPPGLTSDPKRCEVSTSKDLYTLEIAMSVREHLRNITGSQPHVVVNNLHRVKLDANRDRGEATFGNPLAEEAWDDFTGFVESALRSVGAGLVVDLHGQVHAEGWVELGYTISGSSLDASAFRPEDSSIRQLAARAQGDRGVGLRAGAASDESLGAAIERAGRGRYSAVPSPSHPGPDGGGYFSGGYIASA